MKLGGIALGSALAIAGSGLQPRTARACSLIGYDEVVLTPSADTMAPTLAVLGATVSRGEGSCEGSGAVVLELSSADDQTPAAEIAYRVLVLRSNGTEFRGLPTVPFNQFRPTLALHFEDSGQPVEVTLQVSAVDRSGNVGDPVTIDVVDPDTGGCSVGGAAGAGWLAALALVPLVRRRRR